MDYYPNFLHYMIALKLARKGEYPLHAFAKRAQPQALFVRIRKFSEKTVLDNRIDFCKIIS